MINVDIDWKDTFKWTCKCNIAGFYGFCDLLRSKDGRSLSSFLFRSSDADSGCVMSFWKRNVDLRWSMRLRHMFICSKQSLLNRFFYFFGWFCWFIKIPIFFLILSCNSASPDIFFYLDDVLFKFKPIWSWSLIFSKHKLDKIGEFWWISLLE